MRGWGVETAYFIIAVQVVDKLNPMISCPCLKIDTFRLYFLNRRTVWNPTEENNILLSDIDCQRLRNAVFNGEAIEGNYIANGYLRNTSGG